MLFFVTFGYMIKPATINIAVSVETHRILVDYIQEIDGKIGKFTDKAIKEKIEKEKSKQKL